MIVINRHKGNILLFILLFLPHLKTDYFELIPRLEQFTNIYRVLTILIAIMWFLINKCAPSVISLLIGGALFYQVINTIIQSGDIYSFGIYAIGVLGVFLLIDMGVRIDALAMIKGLLFCFEVFIYINLFTEFAYPNGLYIKKTITGFVSNYCWFLGYYNQHTRYYIPLFLLLVLYTYATKNHKRMVFDMAIVLISVIKVWSGGVIVSIISMTLAYFVLKPKNNILLYYFSWIMQPIFLIVVLMLDRVELLTWIVANILNKGLTLELRMRLWNRIIGWIGESVMFGYGTQASIVRTTRANMNWASGAHNMILEVMYRGGIVYLVFFIVVILFAGNRLKECKDEYIRKALAISFLGWGLQSFVDVNTSSFLMSLFAFAYYAKELAIQTYNELEMKN